MKPLYVAIFRSLLGAFLTAATVLFTMLASTDLSARQLTAAVGSSFIGYIVTRGGVEGWYDQSTNPTQNR